MEPAADGQARRRTGSADQVSFDGDDAGGSTVDEPGSWRFRTDGGHDRTEVRRRERRRERERRWEQLQLVT